MDELKTDNNKNIILCCDGAWQHRGWNSTQGTYVVFEHVSKKVLKVFHYQKERKSRLKGNEDKNVELVIPANLSDDEDISNGDEEQ